MHRHPLLRKAAAALAAAAAAAALTACGGDSGSPSETITAPDVNRPPASITWEPWQGLRLPRGAEDGPAQTPAAATGFSRTPQGAALAAIHHSTRLGAAPDNVWAEIARAAIADGPGKDFWVLNRARLSIVGPVDAAEAPTITGYQIPSYSDDRAEVTIFTTYPDDSLLSTRTVVTWTAQDWRLNLPDPADQTPTVTAVATLPADAILLEAS